MTSVTEHPSRTRPRVLIVDDEFLVTRRIGELFELSGYGAEGAHSAGECMRKLDTDSSFDAVILDIELGLCEPHGGEVAASIRDRYGIPVVFYTAHTDRETIALTRDTDSFGIVAKAPDDEEILLAAVETAIRRARIEDEAVRGFDTYRQIVFWMPAPIIVFTGSDGTPHLVNDAAERLFGRVSKREYEALFDEPASSTTLNPRIDSADTAMHPWTVVGPLTDRRSGNHWLVATRRLRDADTIHVHYDVTTLEERRREIERDSENAHALLADVHHRVKNNLAIVDALIDMAQQRLAEPETLATVRTQVRAVRVLHERLHASQRHREVEIAGYLEDVARSSLRADRTSRLETAFLGCGGLLPGRVALPLGLIVAELITNAQKHSFLEPGDHWLRVTLRDRDEAGACEVGVEYDGVPLPADDVLENAKGSGLTLVRGLVRQLDAELEIEREPHNAFRIRLRTP